LLIEHVKDRTNHAYAIRRLKEMVKRVDLRDRAADHRGRGHRYSF
jgi:hypothetical protein